MRVNRGSLSALRDKYRAIQRMRDAARRCPALDPKPDMVALSQRFPGALRELDELPMPIIEQRLAVLEAVVDTGAEVPQWVALQIGYHGFMRAVLRIKRIAAGRRSAQLSAVRSDLERLYRPAEDEPPLSSFDSPAIVAILEPAEGRLNPWVYAEVAARHGVSPAAVRQALFLR